MCDHDRHNSDLYIRTCFADACTALSEIEKGRAVGGGLCLREACHRRLDILGHFLLSHAGKVLFVWLLMVASFSVGLKSSQLTARLESLWLPGRIEQELSYTMSYLGETDSWNNQMIIQVAAEEGANVLHRDALLAHLQIVHKASRVTVQLFDVVWRLKDLCHSASMPTTDLHYIDQIFENISPCNIITPLDCFWEGSKLLGPDYPVSIPNLGNRVKWTNLNPKDLLDKMKSYQFDFEFRILEEYLNKAGISTAYQEKPCLDPTDPECPETAPNKHSKEVPDIGALMSGGCYGYANNYMHWPEQLIVGGVVRNKTQHVKRAQALQTVIQLMGDRDMYDFWQDTYKVHHIGWSQDKARLVIDTWQKRFAQEVKRLEASYTQYKSYPFSMATLNESLKQYTNINVVKLAIVISLLLVYCMFMGQYIAVFGVIMLILNTLAGLGFCSLLGIPLNVLTIQVVPYLCVGLSLRDIWTLLHHYKLTKDTKQTIRQCTPNITTHNLYLCSAFLACCLLPAPAILAAALQCTVLIVFNTLAVLIVFPTILSIDQRRKQAYNNIVRNYMSRQATLNKPTGRRHFPSAKISECCCDVEDNTTESKNRINISEILLNRFVRLCCLVCLVFGVFFGIYHAYHLRFGLKMPEFLPRNCTDTKYLTAHEKHFGFYGFSTVTMDIDYPSNQNLIKEYHNTIANMKNVLGSESNPWLETFQHYLMVLQTEFDVNLKRNCLNSEGWHSNASENAVLAYKLLANTGNVNFPIEKSEITTKRLVDKGLIEMEPFYNYFSVWFSNDPIMSFIKNTFRPFPKHFFGSKNEFDLKIPKTKPLKYVETQFYAEKLHDTEEIIELLQEIRKTSDSFNEKGMKNYPKGLIFAFYDQFVDFFTNFATIFGINFAACFIFAFFLLNFNTSLFLVAFQMVLIIFLGIFYSLLGIEMNILFILSASLAMAIFGRNHIALIEGFVTSIGNRDRRTKLTIEQNFWPMFQANLAFIISIAVFYTSDFDFIKKYYFYAVMSTIIVDFISSFVFFPIFLSCFGPKPMLIPLEHADRITTPSPQPSPVVVRKHNNHHHHHSNRTRRHHSSSSGVSDSSVPGVTKQQTTREPSLTTITEESGCSITVQPEVVVQTTYNNQGDSSNSNNSSQHVTTKVTATANIKVEVHSRPNSRREERDRDKDRDRDRDNS